MPSRSRRSETYAKCAEISTELARYIREELGYEAVARRNRPRSGDGDPDHASDWLR